MLVKERNRRSVHCAMQQIRHPDRSCHGFVAHTRCEKRLGPATNFQGTIALSFVIPSEAEGSAVQRPFLGNSDFDPQTKLSSRPERSVVERSAVSLRHENPKSCFALRPCILARSEAGTKSNMKSNNCIACRNSVMFPPNSPRTILSAPNAS